MSITLPYNMFSKNSSSESEDFCVFEYDPFHVKDGLQSPYRLNSFSLQNSPKDRIPKIKGKNMKQQVLQASTWVRVYWKDEHLQWDSKNYSGITNVNFAPEQIWVPDIVLYNSADSKGSGLLDVSLKTQVIVSSNGKCSWFCPIIFRSECTVNIEWFPFDTQSCPMKFGLWTYDGSRVNFSNLRATGDTLDYIPSGEWNLNSMPIKRNVVYYACCPTTPYPDVTFYVNLTRRTKFYLMNIIWPGILIALLATLTFLLPPESGERVGLGITNLLAMMLFLLLISESTPATSDAVPLATKFFSIVLVLSALALVSSCVVIKFLHFSNHDVSNIPWLIREVVNKYLATLLFVDLSWGRPRRNCTDQEKIGIENPAMTMNGKTDDMNGVRLRAINKEVTESETDRSTTEVKPFNSVQNTHNSSVADGMKEIVGKLKRIEDDEEYKAQWRKAIKVLDRFFTVVFLISLLTACVAIFTNAPRFYVP